MIRRSANLEDLSPNFEFPDLNAHSPRTSKTCPRLPPSTFEDLSPIPRKDVKEHQSDADAAIRGVRDWLKMESRRERIPGAKKISQLYALFKSELPSICLKLDMMPDELTFVDFTEVVAAWLASRATT